MFRVDVLPPNMGAALYVWVSLQVLYVYQSNMWSRAQFTLPLRFITRNLAIFAFIIDYRRVVTSRHVPVVSH